MPRARSGSLRLAQKSTDLPALGGLAGFPSVVTVIRAFNPRKSLFLKGFIPVLSCVRTDQGWRGPPRRVVAGRFDPRVLATAK